VKKNCIFDVDLESIFSFFVFFTRRIKTGRIGKEKQGDGEDVQNQIDKCKG